MLWGVAASQARPLGAHPPAALPAGITKWAEIENSCPFCKQRFARLRRKRLAPRAALAGLDPSAELPGVYLDTQEVEQRNQVGWGSPRGSVEWAPSSGSMLELEFEPSRTQAPFCGATRVRMRARSAPTAATESRDSKQTRRLARPTLPPRPPCPPTLPRLSAAGPLACRSAWRLRTLNFSSGWRRWPAWCAGAATTRRTCCCATVGGWVGVAGCVRGGGRGRRVVNRKMWCWCNSQRALWGMVGWWVVCEGGHRGRGPCGLREGRSPPCGAWDRAMPPPACSGSGGCREACREGGSCRAGQVAQPAGVGRPQGAVAGLQTLAGLWRPALATSRLHALTDVWLICLIIAECDRACHTFCAGLQEIPAGEWFCPQCQQRRGRARQRRRQPAGRPAATGRRRRAEADVVLVESSQESEEGEGRRPAQRRRTAAGGRRARGAGGGASRAADDDLSDFVVPDESEEDSDWLAEYGPSEPARSRSAGARGRAARGGAAAARAQRGARPQRSARRQRQAASSGGSDESTHDRFQDSGVQGCAEPGVRLHALCLNDHGLGCPGYLVSPPLPACTTFSASFDGATSRMQSQKLTTQTVRPAAAGGRSRKMSGRCWRGCGAARERSPAAAAGAQAGHEAGQPPRRPLPPAGHRLPPAAGHLPRAWMHPPTRIGKAPQQRPCLLCRPLPAPLARCLVVGCWGALQAMLPLGRITPSSAPAALATLLPLLPGRNVAALAASWDDLRQGSTTFAELRRSGSAGSGRSSGAAAPAQPPRRRLVRAGALGGSADGGGGGSAAGRAASTDEIVDLLDSPSPGLLRSGRAGAAAAGAAAANDEQLAWQAMQAALEEGGDQQRQRGRARQWRAVQSPAGGGGGKDEDEDEELDLPLAGRLGPDPYRNFLRLVLRNQTCKRGEARRHAVLPRGPPGRARLPQELPCMETGPGTVQTPPWPPHLAWRCSPLLEGYSCGPAARLALCSPPAAAGAAAAAGSGAAQHWRAHSPRHATDGGGSQGWGRHPGQRRAWRGRWRRRAARDPHPAHARV